MLWSYSEVVAYIHESEDDLGVPVPKSQLREKEILSSQLVSPQAAFGGCATWADEKADFVLIAENSEIHGPNPLFTIPPAEHVDADLNLLCTQILSADYQGLSNNKNIPGKNAQLLMPDISCDIHAAVNHFILFDSEARGFVRPICFAYITSDKNKLINLAKPILEALNEAALFIQHSNITHCQKDFKTLFEGVQHATSVNVSGKSTEDGTDNVNSLKAKKRHSGEGAESVLRDVQDILEVMQSFKLHDYVEDSITSFVQNLLDSDVSKELRNNSFLWILSLDGYQSYMMPQPVPQNASNHLQHLLLASPGGMVLGLYHLYIMYKYFKRKYENVDLSSRVKLPANYLLHFGACIKSPKCDENASYSKCCVCGPVIPTLSYRSPQYGQCLDVNFADLLFQFSKSNEQIIPSNNCTVLKQENGAKSPNSVMNSKEYEFEAQLDRKPCRHITSLNSIWDTLDIPEQNIRDHEPAFLHVLQLFQQTEDLLFALLSRTLIVVVCSPEELSLARSFLTALATFVPRTTDEEVFVELNGKAPLKIFQKLAAVNICLSDFLEIEDFLSPELMQLVCILNLKNKSFTGPRYSGSLLSGINARFKQLPADGPAFSVLISALLEVEQGVMLWRRITALSLGDSQVARHMLQRGFTTCDIHIVRKLATLCKS